MEKISLGDHCDAQIIRNSGVEDRLELMGLFHAWCVRDGKTIWEDDFPNTVMTLGKNLVLDNSLAGSAYTSVGPFMGLISSASYSAIAAADTMASHAGWLEAGSANAPTFSARITTNGGWSAASAGSKALSAALAFTMTGSGTLKGAFLVTGSGAVATIANTSGTLLSAGLFSGGDRAVLSTDVVNVSYSMAA